MPRRETRYKNQKYVLHMLSVRTYSTSPSRGYLVDGLPRAASFEHFKKIRKIIKLNEINFKFAESIKNLYFEIIFSFIMLHVLCFACQPYVLSDARCACVCVQFLRCSGQCGAAAVVLLSHQQ